MNFHVYLALCLLALFGGLAVVVLIRVLTETDVEDEIPSNTEDRPPATYVTKWGIHRDHINRGFETEAGCPVCYEFRLHVD
jgi:hypothetical protein